MNPTQDGLHVECLPLKMLVKQAYGIVDDVRILGVPGWAQNAFYSIDAKVSAEDIGVLAKLKPEQRNLMLQALLEDRFKLKARRETRNVPVYALVVAKGGSKLTAWKSDDTGVPMMRMRGKGEIDATGATLEFLPGLLVRELDRPVVDRTGLTGKYNFKLQFTPATNAGSDSTAPTIFTAVQEQLGLKLEPTTAALDILVVDHIEKATEN